MREFFSNKVTEAYYFFGIVVMIVTEDTIILDVWWYKMIKFWKHIKSLTYTKLILEYSKEMRKGTFPLVKLIINYMLGAILYIWL